MITCIVVDDEQHAIDILMHYIKQTPLLSLVGNSTNPIEALQIIATQKVDLVFLDIHMPELSGIDFIKALNGKAKVILTTAYICIGRVRIGCGRLFIKAHSPSTISLRSSKGGKITQGRRCSGCGR